MVAVAVYFIGIGQLECRKAQKDQRVGLLQVSVHLWYDSSSDPELVRNPGTIGTFLGIGRSVGARLRNVFMLSYVTL